MSDHPNRPDDTPTEDRRTYGEEPWRTAGVEYAVGSTYDDHAPAYDLVKRVAACVAAVAIVAIITQSVESVERGHDEARLSIRQYEAAEAREWEPYASITVPSTWCEVRGDNTYCTYSSGSLDATSSQYSYSAKPLPTHPQQLQRHQPLPGVDYWVGPRLGRSCSMSLHAHAWRITDCTFDADHPFPTLSHDLRSLTVRYNAFHYCGPELRVIPGACVTRERMSTEEYLRRLDAVEPLPHSGPVHIGPVQGLPPATITPFVNQQVPGNINLLPYNHPGDGKMCPSKDKLTEADVGCQMSGGPYPGWLYGGKLYPPGDITAPTQSCPYDPAKPRPCDAPPPSLVPTSPSPPTNAERH